MDNIYLIEKLKGWVKDGIDFKELQVLIMDLEKEEKTKARKKTPVTKLFDSVIKNAPKNRPLLHGVIRKNYMGVDCVGVCDGVRLMWTVDKGDFDGFENIPLENTIDIYKMFSDHNKIKLATPDIDTLKDFILTCKLHSTKEAIKAGKKPVKFPSTQTWIDPVYFLDAMKLISEDEAVFFTDGMPNSEIYITTKAVSAGALLLPIRVREDLNHV